MEQHLEDLGLLIDRLENLTYSLRLPVQDKIHLEGLRGSLPEIVEELKVVLESITMASEEKRV